MFKYFLYCRLGSYDSPVDKFLFPSYRIQETDLKLVFNHFY